MRKIQIGELLPDITDNFEKSLRDCIEKNKHRREPYFILATADWYNNDTEMRVVVSPREKKPPMMLNTMCWRVDNKTGQLKELWVLPKDAPIDPSVEFDGVEESLIKVARHLPILYN
ncbi:MAG: hypothetical protein HWN69_07040 [Desulfobacterales bacterium]|nr:hypothetical protein [Desulfobacterales bacterium]